MDEGQLLPVEERGNERREVHLHFTGTGWDLLGWGILNALSYIALAIPVAWWYRGFYRWATRHTRAADGSTFAFTGDPKAIWYWFVPLGMLMAVENIADDPRVVIGSSLAALLVGFWVSWRVMGWLAEGVLLREGIRFRFTGHALPYIRWQILLALSMLTVVGWAWVQVAFQRWLYRHVESDDAELRWVGKPAELLRLGLLLFGVPALLLLVVADLPLGTSIRFAISWFVGLHLADITIFSGWMMALLLLWMVVTPWLQIIIWRWYARNTRVLVKAPEVVLTDTPVAAE